MAEPLEINGIHPELAGRVCSGLYCQQYWHAGTLVEDANVVYLNFNESWYRLYFDYGIIFWWTARSLPQSFDAPELDAQYRVVDLGTVIGVVGRRLHRYEMRAIDGGSEVEFVFEGARSVVFRNVDDCSTVRG